MCASNYKKNETVVIVQIYTIIFIKYGQGQELMRTEKRDGEERGRIGLLLLHLSNISMAISAECWVCVRERERTCSAHQVSQKEEEAPELGEWCSWCVELG